MRIYDRSGRNRGRPGDPQCAWYRPLTHPSLPGFVWGPCEVYSSAFDGVNSLRLLLGEVRYVSGGPVCLTPSDRRHCWWDELTPFQVFRPVMCAIRAAINYTLALHYVTRG